MGGQEQPPKMIQIRPAAAVLLALAGPAGASDLNGCWKMVEARNERQSGKVETSKSDCIRAYQGTVLVTSCRGGKEVAVYTLTDMTVASYSFAPVGSQAARAAAFRVAGSTLHMMLSKSPAASADPIVRTEQRLSRIPAAQCAALASHLPGPLPADAPAVMPASTTPPRR